MLNLVSFVGVDEHTTQGELSYLSHLLDLLNTNKWLFNVELGFLYSESRAGTQTRYPSFQFIDDYIYSLQYSPFRTSIHLCGQEAINHFLNQDDGNLIDVCHNVDRIQLNLNINQYDLNELTSRIMELAKDYTIIIQDNNSKQKLVEALIKNIPFNSYLGNVNFLYDASGGFGKEIKDIKPVHKFNYTGYAGGINPYNVLDIVKSIKDNNETDASYYIDMESGIRTNDKFDINKCMDIILNLYHHLNYRTNT